MKSTIVFLGLTVLLLILVTSPTSGLIFKRDVSYQQKVDMFHWMDSNQDQQVTFKEAQAYFHRADGVPADQLDKIMEGFTDEDKNGNGAIDFNELYR